MSTAPHREMTDRERRQHEAFDVHSALVIAEATFPHLRRNPQWQILRMDAYETFHGLLVERAQ